MAGRSLRKNSFGTQKLQRTGARRQALDQQRQLAELAGGSRRNDLVPDLVVTTVAVAELQESVHRVREIKPEHVTRLTRSIADLGFCQPVLIAGGEIIDGHARIKAAKLLGLTEVPAIDCAHLSAAEVRKLRLAINRIGELGEWDLGLLKVEVRDLLDLEIDLDATGFSSQELDIIVLDAVGEVAEGEDEALDEELLDNVVTRRGDIWVLGDHRIACGSSIEPETIERLLGDEPVHAVIADFPYNVPIGGNVSGLGKVRHGEFAMASGEMTREEFHHFLAASLECCKRHLLAGSAVFGFMDWRSIDLLYRAGETAGLSLVNLIVWYKQSGGMGGNYRSAHELIALLCNGPTLRTNNIQLGRHGRDRTNVWSMPGANRPGSSANEMLRQHATPKPVELCVDALLDVTHRGETVLDPFLGSGTTLIAAEKCRRRCVGIELEPRFVDVALARWSKLSGSEPILLETGEPLAEVAGRREADVDQSSQPGGFVPGTALPGGKRQ